MAAAERNWGCMTLPADGRCGATETDAWDGGADELDVGGELVTGGVADVERDQPGPAVEEDEEALVSFVVTKRE